MKRGIFIAAVSLLFGVSANAQIKVTSSEIQIGDGLTVGSSQMDVKKPVYIWPYTLQQTGVQDLKIGYGNYGLQLGLSGLEVRPQSNANGVVVNPVDPGISFEMPFAYLQPISNLGTSLGSANYRFRYLYVKRVEALESNYASDERYKENIEGLGSSMPLIESLRPVRFDFKADFLDGDTTGLKGKVGFIAQEVQYVLPGLVDYLPESDMYTLNYVGMIPYIVKAFQEERAEVEVLREENAAMSEAIETMQEELAELKAVLGLSSDAKAPQASGVKEDADRQNEVQGFNLYQNQPNPFTEATVIRYELPQGTQAASLQVFDMQGRKVMERALPQGVASGQEEIDGNTLQPGMYTYALVVAGKMMASKKMVVTE